MMLVPGPKYSGNARGKPATQLCENRSRARATRRRSLRLLRSLLRLTESFDSPRNDVARAQVLRWFVAEAHAGRRPGADHIARQQRHELRYVADQERNVEDHVGCVALLLAHAVDVQPHWQMAEIGHFVDGGQEGAERRKAVSALAF